MKFKVGQKEIGARLDKFLVAKLKNKTRGQIQNLISAGGVVVDGKVVSNHYGLKEREIVEIRKFENLKIGENKKADDLRIKIVFANDAEDF